MSYTGLDLNWYAYANNNPIMMIDAEGLKPKSSAFGIDIVAQTAYTIARTEEMKRDPLESGKETSRLLKETFGSKSGSTDSKGGTSGGSNSSGGIAGSTYGRKVPQTVEKEYKLINGWLKLYSEGSIYYIPVVLGDIKAHTYPNGIYQTGYGYPGAKDFPNNNDSSIIEFMGGASIAGLTSYDIVQIIVYDLN